MAHAAAEPTRTTGLAPDEMIAVHPSRGPRVTPGKVAMWLFLATEVMFFTGLIGSYIVFRAGSPPTAYSNLYPPATPADQLAYLEGTVGVKIESHGKDPKALAGIIQRITGLSDEETEEILKEEPGLVNRLSPTQAENLETALKQAGARAERFSLQTYNWPLPYNSLTNPLSIDLTAINTFILICSSLTMVRALAAIQRGDKLWCSIWLLATVLIGSCFLSVQVYEYRELMFGRYYPVGISANHHFRPSSSLFASCFFTMTGFHGAHVAGGIILLTCIFIQSLLGSYTREHHSPVELAGLYWHFVDLVWIILFTVVYLI